MTTQAASELLLSPLGPSCAAPDATSWWERQRELAAQWTTEAEEAGLADRALASHAAFCLLLVIEHRAIGYLPGEPIREPDSWSEIDAYEILFQIMGHTGGDPFWEFEDLLRAIGSFADFLGRHGEIGAAEHALLLEEYPVWMERLLEVWDTGCWYERDGTYRPPLQPKADPIEPVDFERWLEPPKHKGKSKKKPVKRKKRRKRYGQRK